MKLFRTDKISGELEQLINIAEEGLVWDGNLICKISTKSLHDNHYIERYNGWNFIGANGVILLQNLGYLRK